jgi:hypothetical protein
VSRGIGEPGKAAPIAGRINAFSLPSKNIENNPMQSSETVLPTRLDPSGKSRAL